MSHELKRRIEVLRRLIKEANARIAEIQKQEQHDESLWGVFEKDYSTPEEYVDAKLRNAEYSELVDDVDGYENALQAYTLVLNLNDLGCYFPKREHKPEFWQTIGFHRDEFRLEDVLTSAGYVEANRLLNDAQNRAEMRKMALDANETAREANKTARDANETAKKAIGFVLIAAVVGPLITYILPHPFKKDSPAFVRILEEQKNTHYGKPILAYRNDVVLSDAKPVPQFGPYSPAWPINSR